MSALRLCRASSSLVVRRMLLERRAVRPKIRLAVADHLVEDFEHDNHAVNFSAGVGHSGPECIVTASDAVEIEILAVQASSSAV